MEVRKGYMQSDVGIVPNDWNVKSLYHYWNVVDCKHITAQFVLDGYPVASIKEVQSKFVDLTSAKQTTKYFYEHLIQGGRKPEVGDLIISRNATVGEVTQVASWHPPFAMGQDVCLLRKKSNELSTDFLQMVLSSSIIRSQLENIMVGSTFKRVNVEQIKNLAVPMPNSNEQTAIATALSDTDALITSLETLIAKKNNIKQGAMQQLLTGKKRLPGFNGKWEEEKFPSVCWYQEGPGVRTHQFTKMGVKLLNGTNIHKGKLSLDTTDKFISEQTAFGAYSHFLAEEGDVIIACSGITVDKFHEKVTTVSKYHLPLCMNTSTMRFKIISKRLIKDYLIHFLKSKKFKEQVGDQATGSAQLNFGPYHIERISITLPPTNEQSALAELLSDMDAEIESLEGKMEKYKLIKQGMMQELLTGKTRLV